MRRWTSKLGQFHNPFGSTGSPGPLLPPSSLSPEISGETSGDTSQPPYDDTSQFTSDNKIEQISEKDATKVPTTKPHDCRLYIDAWDEILRHVDVDELKAVRAVCLTLYGAATPRLLSHAVMYGYKENIEAAASGEDIVWCAHASIPIAPHLWPYVKILDIVGSCDCDATWTMRTKCLCLPSLGDLLDEILPHDIHLDTIRIHLRWFRLGHAFMTERVTAKQTIYIVDLCPPRPCYIVLPMTPIAGSTQVTISVLHNNSPCLAYTDFLQEGYDPDVDYDFQFTYAPTPRLPGWYGVEACGARIYTNHDVPKRFAVNFLSLLAAFTVHYQGTGRFMLAAADTWPRRWFLSDQWNLGLLVSPEGGMWSLLVPFVIEALFPLRLAEAMDVPLHSYPESTQEVFYEAAAEYLNIVTEPFPFEEPCLAGCAALDFVVD
ncbi:hypothetical protein CC85DRAFT_293824 [Cutaneotrichosporon oleaginosum]|uniref:F-box domain-containing protein n=1 Tax=Cutaneotrichosporon oleaginosum TaxID=879819 RepID=A0A0J1AVY4_9TREE|nr:uncharacterized protein CC85DRAFT_293824 [Cutaneotrichosporon oleaginosum]KLT39424.1 hypothetical protein CC85DRAFT_293824 [Cutaneotrichosporon oleaginosum]TXT08431.1 hypothetical protein COLE_05355 [Cutaneotrichosporon oleaginosum]